jgi:hypothetical protein
MLYSDAFFMEVDVEPSDYAKRMRPVFIVSLMLLMLLVIGQFIIRAYLEAITTFFVILIGVFVLSGPHGISPPYCMGFTVMAIVEGIFDTISCILYFQHSKYKLFDEKATRLALIAQVVFILSPILLFSSAAISYSILNDFLSQPAAFQDETLPLVATPNGRSASRFQAQHAAWQQQQQPAPPPRPFQGSGHRLSDAGPQ